MTGGDANKLQNNLTTPQSGKYTMVIYSYMKPNEYWTGAHVNRYKVQDWINKPSIFVTQIIDLLPKTGKVLDLAAGQGQDSRYFAKLGFDVTSTDFNNAALELSKEKADAEDLTIDFLQVDAGQPLPFEDNSFDIVFSHLGIHYFNEKRTKAVFSEVNRVLKPGGFFAFLANTVDDPEIKEANFMKVEENFYKEVDTGLEKAYFSVDYVNLLNESLFEIILLDATGETYKDMTKKLIRFVGRKSNTTLS